MVVALSQFIPALKIGELAPLAQVTFRRRQLTVTGYIVTYIAPLAFVLAVTMGKEAYDDYQRYLRDSEANSTRYLLVIPSPTASPFPADSPDPAAYPSTANQSKPLTRSTPSSALKVGDLVLLEKNQRVPADMVLLVTSEEEGTCFVRTDQLDGETDWKLKVAPGDTQRVGEGGAGALEGSLYGMSTPFSSLHIARVLTVSRPTLERHSQLLRRPDPDIYRARSSYRNRHTP